jgi:phage-related protein
MLTLSAAAIVEKNALSNTGAWIILVEITLLDSTVLRICNNTKNVVWPTVGGETFVAFPFQLDDIEEDNKGSIQEVTIRVGNVSGAMEAYMAVSHGGKGATVRIMVVHSKHLDLTSPEYDETFSVIDSSSNAEWATFRIGGTNPWQKRFPRCRLFKTFCRYGVFGPLDRYGNTSRCGYATDKSYTTGTVSVTTGDATVTGAGGASWDPIICVGDRFTVDGLTDTYYVLSVTDATHLVLTDAWEGAVLSGQTYEIYKDCDRSLVRCRALGNSENFGGAPGVESKWAY